MKELVHVEAIERIARDAGAAIMDVYQREDLGVTSKDDDSPLTQADLAAHKVIVEALAALTPKIPVLSEEDADIPWSTRQQWQRYWLVDPLDGTKEFIKRNGEFTVNIALIEMGIPVLGVVYVPVLDIMYLGVDDGGAFKVEDGVKTSIKVRSIVPEQKQLTVVASRSHRGEELEAWLTSAEKLFSQMELLSMGSSLKICLVAEGKADIYPRLALTSEWDTAAAQAVLEAAGGTLVDPDFKEYRYNQKENILNPFFFAIGDSNFAWSDVNQND